MKRSGTPVHMVSEMTPKNSGPLTWGRRRFRRRKAGSRGGAGLPSSDKGLMEKFPTSYKEEPRWQKKSFIEN